VNPLKVNRSAKLSSPTPWLIAASVALAVALVSGGFTGRFISHSVVAKGTVTGLNEQSGENGKMFAPEYTFVTQDGRIWNAVSTSSSNPPAYQVGQSIRVLYDPHYPEHNRIDSFWHLWGFSAAFLLVAAILAVLGFAMRSAKRRRAQVTPIAAG
jgi:hypothetical protein